MGYLPRAGEVIKGFILFKIDKEEIAMDNKIVTAILIAANYKHFISQPHHHINPAIEYKKESFPLLNLYKVLEYSFQNNIVNTSIILLSIENQKNAILVENLKESTKEEMKFDSKHPP